MMQGSKRESPRQKIICKLRKPSKAELRRYLQAEMLQNAPGKAGVKIRGRRISQLVDEEALTCAVCLQIFLKPVLTPCGHCFCLQCSEDLAINGFPCGICHSQKPSLDLIPSKQMEKLVSIYLGGAAEEEREDYRRRMVVWGTSECKRSVEAFYEGLMVDYWNEEELCWKVGRIHRLSSYTVFVEDSKTKVVVEISIQSRKLANVFFHTTSYSTHKIQNPTFPFTAQPALTDLPLYHPNTHLNHPTQHNYYTHHAYPNLFSPMPTAYMPPAPNYMPPMPYLPSSMPDMRFMYNPYMQPYSPQMNSVAGCSARVGFPI